MVGFPEERLRGYLRVFVPPGEVEAELDAIAEEGLAREVTDELELYRIAHERLSARPGVTPSLEAAVLTQEVGLPAVQTAAVLDLDEARVRSACEDWDTEASPPRRRWGAWVAALAAAALVVGLTVLVLSPGGQARLAARGIDPAIALPVALAFVVGGTALLRASSGGRRR